MPLGDGLTAFTFSMLTYDCLSNLLRQHSPTLPVVHVQCGTHPVLGVTFKRCYFCSNGVIYLTNSPIVAMLLPLLRM